MPLKLMLQVWLLVVARVSLGESFTLMHPNMRPSISTWQRSSTSSTKLNAVTPVGPFCPFRSNASVEMEPRMQQLNAMGPEFATEMNKVQLDMQMGKMPDKDLLLRVSEGMEAAVESWETLIARLKLSSDFQTREYGKLTQAHLEAHDTSVESIASMMKWQAQSMNAVANGNAPPMPPPDVDLEKLMKESEEQRKSGNQNAPPSMTSMQAAEAITASPFSEDSFESDTIREEYEELVRDHAALISFGGKYGDFDPLGKIAFLDQVDKIEERWDSFFFRFKLMGAINEDYKKQCDDFLDSMNMDEDAYRQLLKKSHQLMREEAERERDGVSGVP